MGSEREQDTESDTEMDKDRNRVKRDMVYQKKHFAEIACGTFCRTSRCSLWERLVNIKILITILI